LFPHPTGSGLPREISKTAVTNVNYKSLQKKPGRHKVERGLCLKAMPDQRAYWLARYRINGIERETSLGSAYDITLADAKLKHLANTVKVDKVDPLAGKRRAASQVSGLAAGSGARTFGQAADNYLERLERGAR
jgi:Arm DNA-binding domain